MSRKTLRIKGSLTHTVHDDFYDGEVSSNQLDGNAVNAVSNAPTESVTHSKSKGQNLTAKSFVTMSHGVN